MHRHLPPRSTRLKQGPFPPTRLCCPRHRQYYGPLRPLTRHRSELRLHGLIPELTRPVEPRPREVSPVARTAFPASRSPYAEEFFGAATPDASPLPWPSLPLKSSALPCSPRGANMSALQDSLHGTGYWFAPPSRRDTPLRHTRSPRCNGSLLRGPLAITATGLSPASCPNLSGHTKALLDSAATRPT